MMGVVVIGIVVVVGVDDDDDDDGDDNDDNDETTMMTIPQKPLYIVQISTEYHFPLSLKALSAIGTLNSFSTNTTYDEISP